ncbi:hypothetical protein BDW75DRAFT_125173 [Aspergillus navahoensis]
MSQVSKKRRAPRKPIVSEEAWMKINAVGDTLIANQSLRHDKDERAVASAIISLSQTARSDKERRIRGFLGSVRLKCHQNDTTGVLLCCTAIGNDRMASMNKKQRAAFFEKLRSEHDGPLLSSPVLKQSCYNP